MVGAILPNVALFQRYENDQMELPVREPGAPTWSHVAKHGRKVRRLEMIRDRELKAGWDGDIHFGEILISRSHPNIIDTCLCSSIEREIAMVAPAASKNMFYSFRTKPTIRPSKDDP